MLTREPNGPRKVRGHVILGLVVAFEFQTVLSSHHSALDDLGRDYPDIRGGFEIA